MAAQGDRRREWLDLAERTLIEKASTPSGVRLRFRPDAEAELRRLAELERDCCGFAAWSVSSDDGAAVLDVSSEGEGVAAVRELFAEPVP